MHLQFDLANTKNHKNMIAFSFKTQEVTHRKLLRTYLESHDEL
jgi:peptide methionine sulfoxide reductase MsrA